MARSAAVRIWTAALIVAAVALPHPIDSRRSTQRAAADVRDGEALARQRCAGCHAFAEPETLPRTAWRSEVEKMALIIEGKGITAWGERRPAVDLTEPYRKILAYYEARAPEQLASLERWPAPDDRPPKFIRRSIRFGRALTPEPAIANVRLVDLDDDGRLEALACDMRQGAVLLAAPYSPELGMVSIAAVPHPSHVATADLDADGSLDLLVADLGEFLPGDHEKGSAVWLRSVPEGGYTSFALSGFPRVADVEAADFDADGTLDLLVAAFGWSRTGEIALLLNRTENWRQPSFKRIRVDARPGAIHVVPTDLDRDGKMDFVALIAQEHETVVAFLGDGAGGFRQRPLYSAPHPNWGSTGLQVVDLDRDRDLDILITNGDMFDDDILKPYHGIRWLEQKGGMRFEAHPLANLAGVHRATAADVDADGDLDIVAAAFTGVVDSAKAALPSLVWLQQVRPGRFEKHTIETGNATHATLDVGDIDGDGDIDIVTGTFLLLSTSDSWVDVWENQTKQGARR